MDLGLLREQEQENALQQKNIETLLAPDAQAEGQELHPTKTWEPSRDSANPFATCFDRRTFVKAGVAMMGSLAMSYPLQEFQARRAFGTPIAVHPYGTPVPTPDLNTGLNLISLPPGFRYYSFGWRGDPINGGLTTPGVHDGMGVVRQIGSRVVLCRNHEEGSAAAFAQGPIKYDQGGAGGNTNLMFNLQTEQVESAWASLSGTIRNCAGGVTPWASWISCEETGDSIGGIRTKNHGFCFDVPALGAAPAVPLTAMGRFSHEACVVDPVDGYVYETEDAGNSSGFYRFIPNVYGKLALGGTLQMLKVKNVNQANLSGLNPNILSQGQTWDVEWVTIANPTSTSPSVFSQGRTLGGANFARLEGCWYGAERKVYFLSTSGGRVGEGMVFCFDPVSQTLKLIFDSTAAAECDNPDNMVFTPRGGIIMCEDAAGGSNVANERMIGLTVQGETFVFAENLINFSTLVPGGVYTRPGNTRTFSGNHIGGEWCGACYSPDGKWLFVCIQSPGITFAITGPWGNGPL